MLGMDQYGTLICNLRTVVLMEGSSGTCSSLITSKIMGHQGWIIALAGYIYGNIGLVSGCRFSVVCYHALHHLCLLEKQKTWMDSYILTVHRISDLCICAHHG